MNRSVLALDYDGTIAWNDRLHPDVRGAIADARARGVAVILVTGRILGELRRQLADLRVFDAVVAENGAMLWLPAAGERTLGQLPPAEFFAAIAARGLEHLAGACVVDFDAGAAGAVTAVVRELGLPLALQLNRDRLMVLPAGITKASGLAAALAALGLGGSRTIGIGDAENDVDLLRACDLGVAVAWGSPVLRAVADEVLAGDDPSAVAHFIRSRLLAPDPLEA